MRPSVNYKNSLSQTSTAKARGIPKLSWISRRPPAPRVWRSCDCLHEKAGVATGCLKDDWSNTRTLRWSGILRNQGDLGDASLGIHLELRTDQERRELPLSTRFVPVISPLVAHEH